jgi:hypothetical protein
MISDELKERFEALERTVFRIDDLVEAIGEDIGRVYGRCAALEQRVLIIDAFIEASVDMRAPTLVPGVHPTVEDRKDARYGYLMLATAVLFGALCGGLGVWLGL